MWFSQTLSLSFLCVAYVALHVDDTRLNRPTLDNPTLSDLAILARLEARYLGKEHGTVG